MGDGVHSDSARIDLSYFSKDVNSKDTFLDGFKRTSLSQWFGNAGYNRLQNTEESAYHWFDGASFDTSGDKFIPSLTRKQRAIAFFAFLVIGLFCCGLASLYLPFLLLKARKFAMLYSMGSLFLIGSFSMLWGPVNHVRHLCSFKRLPFTVVYFGALFCTIYFAMTAHMYRTALTVFFAIIQILALIWYVSSYIPGGQMGMKFLSKVFSTAVTKTVTNTLPV